MFWQDLIIENMYSKKIIKAVLCDIFKIVDSEIQVVKNIDDVDGDSKIICETYCTSAKFKLRISIYLNDDKLLPEDDRYTVGMICEALGCEALMTDNSDNPFSMLLVRNRITVEQTFINLEEYDNAEECELQ